MSRLRHLLLLAIVLILFPIARASDIPALSDEDRKFKEVPGQPGAPAAILYKDELDDDAHNHVRIYFERVKILTEAGREYATVNIPFARNWSNIESVSGRTIHGDGTIVPFEGKPLDKFIIKTHGIKVHVKTFTMPDVQVGSIIEYRYSLHYGDNSFAAPRWVVQDSIWTKKAHFRFIPVPAKEQLILAHGIIGNGVSYVLHLPDKAAQPKQVTVAATNEQYVDLTIANVPGYVEEPYMPDSEMFHYNVQFFYRVQEIKEGEFWRTEGKYWNKEVEKFLGKRDGIDQALATVVAPTDTPEQKVKKIYAFIGTFENQDYRPNRTTQEMKTLGMKEAKGASDVLQQKSGDREDLTRLFVAMVRAAGIPAYVMELTSREDKFFLESYLSSDQLDAEIAIVELNGKEVFLDPGTKYCPYGLLDWRHTDTKGLRQTAGDVVLASTPSPNYADAVIQRIARFTMSEDGSLTGTLRVGFFGQEALSRRQSANLTDDAGRKKELEDEVKGWLPSGSDVTLTSTPAWTAVDEPLVGDFTIVTNAASNAGKRTLLPAMLFQVNEKTRFPSSERVNPIYLYYPWREVDKVSITVPHSLEIENVPQAEDVSIGYALYKTEWAHNSQTLSVQREFGINGFAIPQARYQEIKGFFDKIKTGDEQQAILRTTATTTTVGK